MTKTQNKFNQYVLMADKGKSLTNGEIYTKILISHKDIDEANWTEVDDSAVPVIDEEPTAEDYETALAEMGVTV